MYGQDKLYFSVAGFLTFLAFVATGFEWLLGMSTGFAVYLIFRSLTD